MTDGSGKRIWTATQAAFGRTVVDEDPDGDTLEVSFHIRFAGQYADIESGLHYNRFRYYDPSTGRYTSADPIGPRGGPNLYTYAWNRPQFYVDPWGTIVLPGSDKHRQRNRNNKCPKKEPKKPGDPCDPDEGGKPTDSEGNEWDEDPIGTNRTHSGSGGKTYRRGDPDNPGSSFQCSYGPNGNFFPGEGNYDYSNPDEDLLGHFANDFFPGWFDSEYESPDPTEVYPADE